MFPIAVIPAGQERRGFHEFVFQVLRFPSNLEGDLAAAFLRDDVEAGLTRLPRLPDDPIPPRLEIGRELLDLGPFEELDRICHGPPPSIGPKATRWGQVGMAAQMVEPVYRQKFVENHAHWGNRVQLADSEILQIEMQPGAESAVAVISYEWYMTESMTLHQSVVRQRWSRAGEGYALISETVVQGDTRLFAPDDAPGKTAPMTDPMMN